MPLIFPETASFRVVELESVNSPTLRLGVDYWRLQRVTRRFPTRDDIKPDELAGVLRGVAIISVLDAGNDFLHCLLGECVAMAYSAVGRDRRLSEIANELPETARRLRRYYSHVCQTRSPLAVHVSVKSDDSEVNFTEAEALLLPLGISDDAVDHILIFTDFALRASKRR